MISSFEQSIKRAYALASDRRHELVTLEHLLASLLEIEEIQDLIKTAGGDGQKLSKDLLSYLDDLSNHMIVKSGPYQPRHTALLLTVVKKAKTQSLFSNKPDMGCMDLFLATFNIENSHASYFLHVAGLDKDEILQLLRRKHKGVEGAMPESDAEEVLAQFCVNLNEKAKAGKIDPLIGREKEVEVITQIMARRNKHNVIMLGDPGVGKAQPLDSKILTPSGWRLMKDIKVNDLVVTPNGDHATITGVYPQGVKDIYKITFSDGRTAESCEEHLWTVFGKFGEEYRTKSGYRNRKLQFKNLSLSEIMAKLDNNKSTKIRIPMVDARINDNVRTTSNSNVKVPIDPWLMGFLLRDGSFSSHPGTFSTADAEILRMVKSRLSEGYTIRKLKGVYDYAIASEENLQKSSYPRSEDGSCQRFKHEYIQIIHDLGLKGLQSHEKFIPHIYKDSTSDQKIDLIAGIVDSDGYVSGNGSISVSTSSERLAHDIQEVVWSIGGQARISKKNPTYLYNGEQREGKINYNVSIRYKDPRRLSKLDRKKSRISENYQYSNLKLSISKIEFSRKAEAQCIMVDHPLHQYITDNYVVTHNTIIVEGLAKRITEGNVPESLADKTIWSLDMGSLVAGTKFRGDFEERMKQVIRAFSTIPNTIMFIDEIHMIMGAGGGNQGAMDAANLLKPALSRGEIRCIGSTTMEEYRKHFEKDRALGRRFQRIDINEPSVEDAKKILIALAPYYTKYHGIAYETAALEAAVDLSVRYIHDKMLPDKAIDVIDSAGARQRIKPLHERCESIGLEQIKDEISRIARVPVDADKDEDQDRLSKLDGDLRSTVFGQDEVINKLVDAVLIGRSGLREGNKTQGAFLFTGPTGVGKTEIAKQLATALGIEFVRFDMSEFQERHTVSKFIGSPPGYVGYGDGSAGSGMLINALEKNPHCIILCDEVEKAHPDIVSIFLQIMDNGMISSQNGKEASARNAFLIFTSNLGAAAMEKPTIGFGNPERTDEDKEAVKQWFAPEFRNRLDGVILFNRLSKDNMERILDKFISQLNTLTGRKNVSVVFDDESKKWLMDKGFDRNMGARPLARVIDEYVKKPLSREMLFGKLKNGGGVMFTMSDGQPKYDVIDTNVNHIDIKINTDMKELT